MNKEDNSISTARLIALWALSESMLGGLLHAAHIPFRGMIISSAAVIIICLIAFYSEKKGEILRATIIVIMIKGAISPHTPVAAYLAVFLQGVFGQLFFYKKKYFFLSSLLFGLTVGILTGSQRIISYTLIFGTTFWEAVNEFIRYVIKELSITSNGNISFNFSLFLIAVYVTIHALCGTAAGLFASKLPKKINSEKTKGMLLDEKILFEGQAEIKNKFRSRKPWWKKLSYDLIVVMILLLLIITYINPQLINLSQKSLLLMVIRAIIITLVWFYFISPLILKLIKKLLNKKENVYVNEVAGIISHFPYYKKIVSEIWKLSSQKKNLGRLSYFVTALISNILTLKLPDNKGIYR